MGADRVPAPLQRSPAAPCPWPARPGSSSHPAAADQPRRSPDPSETGPRRTHARVPDRRLTAPCCEKKQVTVPIVDSSPTRCPVSQTSSHDRRKVRHGLGPARLGGSGPRCADRRDGVAPVCDGEPGRADAGKSPEARRAELARPGGCSPPAPRRNSCRGPTTRGGGIQMSGCSTGCGGLAGKLWASRNSATAAARATRLARAPWRSASAPAHRAPVIDITGRLPEAGSLAGGGAARAVAGAGRRS